MMTGIRRGANARVALREIGTKENDTELLYSLLSQRKTGISHRGMPTYEHHKQFVDSHPYRVWLFVAIDEQVVGSVYILDSNFIGINISKEYQGYIAQAVDEIAKLYPPLPAIASVRGAKYCVNVSPENKMLITALVEMEARLIQHSFELQGD